MVGRIIGKKLKCVIFGDRDVIKNDRNLPEIEKLIYFLISKNIKPVILSNNGDSTRLSLKKSTQKQISGTCLVHCRP